jgi:hypothetical protein
MPSDLAEKPSSLDKALGLIPPGIVILEGWRQRRLGSNAKESTGKKEKTEREKHPYRKEEEKHS